MKSRIVFHGINKKEVVNKVLKTGFKKGTYFARHLEDAICFGGRYVFYVALEVFGDNWQIVCKQNIPPERIKQLIDFNPKELYYNQKATDGLFPKGKPIPCSKCGTDIGDVRLSVLGKQITAKCPKCKTRFN